MTNKNKYFISNWKMFGDLSSFKILNSVNLYVTKNKKKQIKVIFCLPYTLINAFSNKLKNKNIYIGAQNCHYDNSYGPHTGNINAKMIKNVGADYLIIGHSENRKDGDTDIMINKKIKAAIKNNLNIIFCIGETLNQKIKKSTNKVLTTQIDKGLNQVKSLRNIIVAYEPVWSIGTNKIPKKKDLIKITSFIKSKLIIKFGYKNFIKLIYGGSVNQQNVKKFNSINTINGFLIGGASQSGKKFIDIIKNYYK